MPEDTPDAVRGGIEAMVRELITTFDRHGIKKIEPLDEMFDANFHEVMFEAPMEGKEAGQIIQVIDSGSVGSVARWDNPGIGQKTSSDHVRKCRRVGTDRALTILWTSSLHRLLLYSSPNHSSNPWIALRDPWRCFAKSSSSGELGRPRSASRASASQYQKNLFFSRTYSTSCNKKKNSINEREEEGVRRELDEIVLL